jgi:hypothetical protein
VKSTVLVESAAAGLLDAVQDVDFVVVVVVEVKGGIQC